MTRTVFFPDSIAAGRSGRNENTEFSTHSQFSFFLRKPRSRLRPPVSRDIFGVTFESSRPAHLITD